MSAVQDPGSSRPSRVVGLMLLAISVVALVIGVVTLLGGNGSNGAAGTTLPPSPTGGPTGSSPTGRPTSPTRSESVPPTSPVPPTQSTGTSIPLPPPPNPEPDTEPDTRANPVRVFNNGTIAKLAAQAARDFEADGWNVVEVGNYSDGIIPTTTVYFRQGTDEEAAARQLGKKFGMRVEPRFTGIGGASPGLIVMITNDYGGK